MDSKVVLHVYDLTGGAAKGMSKALLGFEIEGVWHTGVVVYGKQYFYGGGICDDAPGKTPYGNPVKTLDLGTTQIPKEVFEDYLRDIQPKYSFEKYNVFEHNCNNFSNEVCEFLTGNGIPSYIIDLPKVFLSTPMGQMLKPMLTQMQSSIQNAGNQHHFH